MLKKHRFPEIVEGIAFLAKKALEQEQCRYNHIYVQGSTGCGKSEGCKEAILKFLGVDRIQNRSFLEKDGKLLGFMHIHGGSMEVDYAIPTLENLDDKHQALDCVLDKFYAEALHRKADMLVILIDDANKQRATRFNNFLKSLLESRILYSELPKTFVVLTGNPANGVYDCSEFDSTVKTSMFCYEVAVNMEDSLKYVIKNLPLVEGFFKANPDMFHQEPTEVDDEKFPTIRGWTNVFRLLTKDMITENTGLVEFLLVGSVGVKAATAFMTWLKVQDIKPPLTLKSFLEDPKDFMERIKQEENFNASQFALDMWNTPDRKIWKKAYKAFKDFPDDKLSGVICTLSSMGHEVEEDKNVFVQMDNAFMSSSSKEDKDLSSYMYDKYMEFKTGKKKETK